MTARTIAAGIATVGALAATAAAAPADEVTLRVERFYEQQFGAWRLRFTGVIPSRAANEYVAILHQRCGQRSSTAIGGATTGEGGTFEAVPRFGTPPQSGIFRALWRGVRSDPVTLRSPVQIFLSRPRSRRYVLLARVVAESNLSGRFIALQRLAGGRWVHVRRARLAPYGFAGYGGGFEARFAIRKRGLQLRVLVPEKTAAPCHLPAVSRTFVT